LSVAGSDHEAVGAEKYTQRFKRIGFEPGTAYFGTDHGVCPTTKEADCGSVATACAEATDQRWGKRKRLRRAVLPTAAATPYSASKSSAIHCASARLQDTGWKRNHETDRAVGGTQAIAAWPAWRAVANSAPPTIMFAYFKLTFPLVHYCTAVHISGKAP